MRPDMLRPLAEPYTFAFLQWPALIGALVITDTQGPAFAARIVLGVWVALMVLASYGRGRGVGFGNAMTLAGACVAGAWWSHPTPWTFAWLAAVLLLLLTAQRLRLRTSHPEAA